MQFSKNKPGQKIACSRDHIKGKKAILHKRTTKSLRNYNIIIEIQLKIRNCVPNQDRIFLEY